MDRGKQGWGESVSLGHRDPRPRPAGAQAWGVGRGAWGGCRPGQGVRSHPDCVSMGLGPFILTEEGSGPQPVTGPLKLTLWPGHQASPAHRSLLT